MDPSYQEFCLKACSPMNCFPIIDLDTFALQLWPHPGSKIHLGHMHTKEWHHEGMQHRC